MKKLVNKKSIIVASFVLFFSALFVSQVFAFRGGHGNCVGIRGLFQLDLDKAQKGEIANIIEKFQPEIDALRDQIRQAREKQQKLLKYEEFNENQVRQAFQSMRPLLEDMVVLRAKMRNEVRTVLTPEQIKQIEEKRAQTREKRSECRKFGQTMMKAWLEMETD